MLKARCEEKERHTPGITQAHWFGRQLVYEISEVQCCGSGVRVGVCALRGGQRETFDVDDNTRKVATLGA